MNAHHGKLPIPLPTITDDPRWIGRFSREVRKSIAALRDRRVIVNGGQRAGGGTPLLKLTIIQGTAADKFQIVPGYVNSVMPTLATVALDATTPPEITVTEPLYVWIKVVGTFGTPDSYVVTIETQTSSAYPSGVEITVTGFTSFWRIGLINFISGTPDTFEILNAHSGGNLGVESFGNVNHWWKI
jgi:hypothetical protein